MIKAIITDVDGVIVGKKPGVNFPLPNDHVIQRLKQVNQKGIPVILCTIKFHGAIEQIIKQAGLNNPHITDGGALISNPIQKKIIKESVFDKKLARKIISIGLENEVYLEVYSSKKYFLQKNHVSEFTKKRTKVVQTEPQVVDSLLDVIDDLDIIKILHFAKDEHEKPRFEKIFEPFKQDVHSLWSTHPATMPVVILPMTIRGVSKQHAAKEVMEYLNISFEEVLGIGDLFPDWEFIKLCKYGATAGKESTEFKALVKTKGEGNYFFAPSVDEDGFLQILDYFKL